MSPPPSPPPPRRPKASGADALFAGGLVLVMSGLWAVWWPLALIAGGAVLLALGLYASLPPRRDGT